MRSREVYKYAVNLGSRIRDEPENSMDTSAAEEDTERRGSSTEGVTMEVSERSVYVVNITSGNVRNSVSQSQPIPLRLWKRLSDKDLLRLSYLLSSTHSKEAAKRYFDVEEVDDEKSMKRLLFDDNHLLAIDVCSICAEDLERCQCDPYIREPAQIVFADLSSSFRTFLSTYQDECLKAHEDVRNGQLTSSPIGFGELKKQILLEPSDSLTIHFCSAFDGVALRGNMRKKLWPFTLLPLDLPDAQRSSIQTVLSAALYIGNSDPSSQIHDRIAHWAHKTLAEPLEKHGTRVTGKIETGIHDDMARRKIYGLKAHSAPGSCPFCLNQGTFAKTYDPASEDRREIGELVPQHMSDGLKERGRYPWYHSIVKMWEVPLDMFHLYCEGVFPKIINEFFGTQKYGCFATDAFYPFEILLPTAFKPLSGRTNDITGSERTLIFETLIVANAIAGNIPPVGALIVCCFHSQFRLLVAPTSVHCDDLHERIKRLSMVLQYLVLQHAPELLTGSKVHQILYHLADSVKRYGSLHPYSSQSHEHLYHVYQRLLCPEITNGLGKTILRNSNALQELRGEVLRRYNEDDNLPRKTWTGKKLVASLHLPHLHSPRHSSPIPPSLCHLAMPSDQFYSEFYLNGKKFSSHRNERSDDSRMTFIYKGSQQYGTFCGVLKSESAPETRVICRPFLLTDDHLEHLSRGLLECDVPTGIVKNAIHAIGGSQFGARIRGVGALICIPADAVQGHAVFVQNETLSIILPLSQRPLLS